MSSIKHLPDAEYKNPCTYSTFVYILNTFLHPRRAPPPYFSAAHWACTTDFGPPSTAGSTQDCMLYSMLHDSCVSGRFSGNDSGASFHLYLQHKHGVIGAYRVTSRNKPRGSSCQKDVTIPVGLKPTHFIATKDRSFEVPWLDTQRGGLGTEVLCAPRIGTMRTATCSWTHS